MRLEHARQRGCNPPTLLGRPREVVFLSDVCWPHI